MKLQKILFIIIPFPLLLLFHTFGYSLDGYLETAGIYYPNKKDLFELRNRLLVEEEVKLKDWLTFYLSGRIDGFISNREEEKSDLLVKIEDAYFDFYFSRFGVKMGYTKVFWGKLDYFAPTDIINPIDISQLFLKNERKEVKLPVFLFSLSTYFGEASHLDFIVLPVFKKVCMTS